MMQKLKQDSKYLITFSGYPNPDVARALREWLKKNKIEAHLVEGVNVDVVEFVK
jgi:stringent starvation protein B